MFPITLLSSTASLFKDTTKAKNPFFKTLSLVLLVRYWEFLFILFYFDKDTTLNEKLMRIEQYVVDRTLGWYEILLVVVLVFATLIVSYALLAISQWLANVYKNILLPFIYNISKGKMVTWESYKESLSEQEQLKTQMKEMQKLHASEVQKFEKEIEAWKDKYEKLIQNTEQKKIKNK